MEITIFENTNDKVQTTITALLEYNRFILSGLDTYFPSKEVPEGSEYEYETVLDIENTQKLMELIAPESTTEEFLNRFAEKFHGANADIQFQSFCLEHEIETYSQSFFDD